MYQQEVSFSKMSFTAFLETFLLSETPMKGSVSEIEVYLRPNTIGEVLI